MPGISQRRRDEFNAESKRHCGELLDLIVAVAARARGADPFAFVRTPCAVARPA
jgi:hypothetical protein